MIVVDTSVWVDLLNGNETSAVLIFRRLVGNAPILVGDLILCEILQGLRSDSEAARVERALRRFDLAAMLDPALAARAAAFYRLLRSRGATVRKTIDLIIGTFCIVRGHALLHTDRDFDPMQRHLGLRVVQS